MWGKLRSNVVGRSTLHAVARHAMRTNSRSSLAQMKEAAEALRGVHTPIIVMALYDKKTIEIECAGSFVLALTGDGRVHTWGRPPVDIALNSSSLDPDNGDDGNDGDAGVAALAGDAAALIFAIRDLRGGGTSYPLPWRAISAEHPTSLTIGDVKKALQRKLGINRSKFSLFFRPQRTHGGQATPLADTMLLGVGASAGRASIAKSAASAAAAGLRMQPLTAAEYRKAKRTIDDENALVGSSVSARRGMDGRVLGGAKSDVKSRFLAADRARAEIARATLMLHVATNTPTHIPLPDKHSNASMRMRSASVSASMMAGSSGRGLQGGVRRNVRSIAAANGACAALTDDGGVCDIWILMPHFLSPLSLLLHISHSHAHCRPRLHTFFHVFFLFLFSLSRFRLSKNCSRGDRRGGFLVTVTERAVRSQLLLTSL